jgi:hypothetical protein
LSPPIQESTWFGDFSSPRLPDGLFSNRKSKLGQILESLATEDAGTFYGHLVRFTVFCYILWTFVIVWGIFFRVLVFCTKKNLATLLFARFFCQFCAKEKIDKTSDLLIFLLVMWFPFGCPTRLCVSFIGADQGCQIFLWTIYQHRENVLNYHKIYQMSIKYLYQMAVK